MTFRPGVFRGLLLMLLGLCLSGCGPSGSGPLDDQKEPHFLAGKSRITMLDYKGAIDSFEKALQVNPKSAAAHFELGWIYDQKEADPAAAIYHYGHYLRLQPRAENADLVKQRISSCKQALADTVYLGPLNDKVQRQLEQVGEENKRLVEQNKRLEQELAKWTDYASQLQGVTNRQSFQPVEPVRAAQPSRSAQITPALLVQSTTVTTAAPQTSSGTTRTHTVKAGETPSLIARKYGVKLGSLMAANPSLDPRRLKIGQVLRIPGA
jgi:LysM repeat protein